MQPVTKRGPLFVKSILTSIALSEMARLLNETC